jgi:hypothetical protein
LTLGLQQLSAEALGTIEDATRALLPRARMKFLAELADALPAHDDVGPGELHRIMAQVFRANFDAPIFGGSGAV